MQLYKTVIGGLGYNDIVEVEVRAVANPNDALYGRQVSASLFRDGDLPHFLGSISGTSDEMRALGLALIKAADDYDAAESKPKPKTAQIKFRRLR